VGGGYFRCGITNYLFLAELVEVTRHWYCESAGFDFSLSLNNSTSIFEAIYVKYEDTSNFLLGRAIC
jgi:hypothetical protein